MEHTKIGPLTVSRLGHGCHVSGLEAWRDERAERIKAAMRTAAECGVTHFDTATGYGGGESERFLGEIVHGLAHPVTVASKVHVQPTAAEMLAKVDASRERLGLACIDLYYIHWPYDAIDCRPAMEALEQCRADGRIRAIGVSNFRISDLEQARQAGRIDAYQMGYNLFWRRPEADILPYCRQHGIAGVTYNSLAGGLLTGRYPRPRDAAPEPGSGGVYLEAGTYPHLYDAGPHLQALAAQEGVAMAALALHWALAQPGIDVVLVGASRPEHARANVAAVEARVSESALATVTAISDEASRWMPEGENIYRLRL